MWTPVLNDLSLFIHKELRKIPWNLTSNLVFLIIKLAVSAEKLIDGMGVGSIDFYLAKHWELSTVSFLCVFFNLGLISWFLFTELIAGESQNFKALASILLVDGRHLRVVFGSQTSLSSNVDNKSCPFILTNHAKFVNHFSININSWDVPE